MTLGQLRKSLTRFSQDMDDAEVILTYKPADATNKVFESLAFVAYSQIPHNDEEVIVCVLGTTNAAVDMMEKGRAKDVNGKPISQTGIDLSADGGQ